MSRGSFGFPLRQGRDSLPQSRGLVPRIVRLPATTEPRFPSPIPRACPADRSASRYSRAAIPFPNPAGLSRGSFGFPLRQGCRGIFVGCDSARAKVTSGRPGPAAEGAEACIRREIGYARPNGRKPVNRRGKARFADGLLGISMAEQSFRPGCRDFVVISGIPSPRMQGSTSVANLLNPLITTLIIGLPGALPVIIMDSYVAQPSAASRRRSNSAHAQET